MNKSDLYYFNLLKKAVTATFLKHNNAPSFIEKWKGEEIISFQEDLFKKVKGRVSEKWFYTYFKNTPEKLPRIDMLNLLSGYAGFTNWNTFKNIHQTKPKKNTNYKIFGILLTLLIAIGIFLSIHTNENQFHFCFIDSIKNEAITKTYIDIKILQENESPLYYKTDSLGCFQYKSKKDFIKFVAQSPYHKTDTIIRFINSNSNKTVKLHSDDYALLLDYYANGNTRNRESHKTKLRTMIANDAEIYQLFGNDIGIEVYSKEDFIRLTTLPTTSIKRIKILEKKMNSGKIVKLKFIVK